jgi:hypothetical protein
MTSVRLNREGTDLVELKLETTGSNFCHFMSENNLLNSDLTYIYGLTDLNVDTSKLTIFPPATDDVLLTIKKRHLGDALNVLADADVSPTFSITPGGEKFYDSTSFIAKLSTYANTFSEQLDDVGITVADHGGGGVDIAAHVQDGEGIPYLKIGIGASGRLEIDGIAQFWDHFVIVLSDYALKLFHYSHLAVNNTLSVTRSANDGVYHYNALLDNAQLVVAGNNLTNSVVRAQKSILTFLDQRLFLTVETHLSTKKNLKVLDGEEKTDSGIARVPFLNEATSTIYSRDGALVDDISLTTKSYAGRVSFLNKTRPVTQWNHLISSYEQKLFRFQLYCIYNVFADGVFSQVKKDVPFYKDGSWDMTIRFINRL